MIWLPDFDLTSSPLLKIAILLPCTTLTAFARVPPTRPAAVEEQAKFAEKRDFMQPKVVRKITINAYKTLYWGDLLCESAVIIADHLPSPQSGGILSFLANGPASLAQHTCITPWWLAGCALMACGATIRLLCYRTLGQLFTFELSIKKGHALVTRGPYSIVRHPSYVGSLLIGIGTVLCHFGPGSWYEGRVGWDSLASKLFTAAWAGWSLVLPMLLMGRVNAEDEILKNEFGEEWEAYARRTPYRLIPLIY